MAARKKNILWTLWGIAFLLSLAALLLPAREEAQPVSARKNGGYVALTFDDGPWPNTTGCPPGCWTGAIRPWWPRISPRRTSRCTTGTGPSGAWT